MLLLGVCWLLLVLVYGVYRVVGRCVPGVVIVVLQEEVLVLLAFVSGGG